ncbi:MAG TPA: helix-turn-helix transcriptional regulator [Actinocrinis sp.]|nr:helix-turn-helix transcriptional regulator [Actinocrinis sp.]
MRDALSSRRVQVRSGSTAQGTWEVAVGRPAPHLQNAVARYRGFRITTAGPRSRVEIPVGLPCVIFGFGPPVTLEDATGAGSGPQPFTAFVIGLRTRCLRLSHTGVVGGVEVMFTPAGAYELLGCAMHEITNAVFPAAAVLGRGTGALEQHLEEAPGWAECFHLLDAFFADRADRGQEGSLLVRQAWSWLEVARPRAAGGKLAAELGWSQRRLELAFHEQVGLTPGAVVRMARFRRAVGLLVRGGLSLAELADRCGYYDQSHFNREFRAVTGTTPQRYLAAIGGPVDIGLPERMEVREDREDRQGRRRSPQGAAA